MPKRIIILGGGFAGVKCARVLSSLVKRQDAEIVLFNRENHFVFSPLLAEVVGSSINPLDVIAPLRQLLPGVRCRTEEVLNIHIATNEVEYEGEDSQPRRLTYDQLVIACGNVPNLHVVPGMADHAFPLKSVGDAAALRSHVMERMEKAEVCADAERRKWYLTFIIVGGGYSGVEVAGEINDLVRSSGKYFQNFTAADVSVALLHSRDQILPEIGSELREFARKQMERAGVKMLLNARVALATPEGVKLQDGTFVKGGTVVCTVGTSMAPVLQRLNVTKESGRLAVESDMRLKGSQNAWAIGDCASTVNSFDGKPSPPTGQFAERQGTQCARNIHAVFHAQPTRPFFFKPLGQLCSIGGHSAVAELMGLRLSGFVAWFLWRGVYLMKLPSWARRFQVGFDWAWLLLFPRDLAHLRTTTTDRVAHAHFEPGDWIFRQGDPPTNFYVIERGEVEIVRTADNQSEEILAVLGAESFFGEMALLNNEPRNASVRARTAVDVLVLGKNVFTQVSGALAPLRQALLSTLNRRKTTVWKNRPDIYERLRQIMVSELMEPVPQLLLKPGATLKEVGECFRDCSTELLFVSEDGQNLAGIVSMSDLIKAWANGSPAETPLKDFMAAKPIVISAKDTAALASAVLREAGVKSLPVLADKDSKKVVGYLRARRLLSPVLDPVNPELSPKGSPAAEMSTARPD